MQQFLAVIFVLLSLWGAVWYFRKKGFAVRGAPVLGRKRAHSIEQVDRMRLTPQHSLHLLRVEGFKLLVGVHPQGITVLTEAAKDREPVKGAVGS
jgi:flagellar biogenesis protein FliO